MKIKAYEYSENFCEENIWHLCQNPALVDFTKQVLIISNSSRNCQFKFQKSVSGNPLVWWDYHVVMLASFGSSHLIYDFDSTLEFPSTMEDYLDQTFCFEENIGSDLRPDFKIITEADYIHSFISDRGHMKDDHGNWISSPPKWPAIGKNGNLTLPKLLDFSETSKEPILSLEEMYAISNAFSY